MSDQLRPEFWKNYSLNALTTAEWEALIEFKSRKSNNLDLRRFSMKTSKYSDSLIMSILKQAEAGTPIPNLCREHGMSSATFYKWKSKYGGMDLSMMTRLKELEAENARLKRMYADERLKSDILQDALLKKF